jgi:hypothetical protein
MNQHSKVNNGKNDVDKSLNTFQISKHTPYADSYRHDRSFNVVDHTSANFHDQ